MMRMFLAQEARFRDGFVRYGQQGKAIPLDRFIKPAQTAQMYMWKITKVG